MLAGFAERFAVEFGDVCPVISVRFARHRPHVALLASDSFVSGRAVAVLRMDDFKPDSRVDGNLVAGNAYITIG